MKISDSKKELAKIIVENGGWRDGADWAAMDKTDGNCNDNAVGFFSGELRPECFGKIKMWRCRHIETSFMGYDKSIFCEKIISNWHQSCLSRSEYFHLYPAPDADGWIEWKGGECPVNDDCEVSIKVRGESGSARGKAKHWSWGHSGDDSDIISYRLHKPEQAKSQAAGDNGGVVLDYGDLVVSIDSSESTELRAKLAKIYAPSIESLAADYRNKLDYADRKRDEADKAKAESDAALSELEKAIAAIGFAITPIGAVAQEPELVIADWRDLLVDDIVEIVGSENETWLRFKGVELFVSRTGAAECAIVFRSYDGDEWCHGGNTNWRFVRRPAK